MAYIDPWGNFTQGMQNLQTSLANIETANQQRELRELAKVEKQAKIDELKRQEETRQGLASIYAQKEEMKPEEYQIENPEYATAQEAYQKSLADYNAQQEAYSGIEGLRAGVKANPMESQLGELQLSGAEQDYQKKYGGLGAPLAPTAPTAPQMLTQTRMVPKYGSSDIQQKAAEFLASRGDWTGLKGIESSADITSKIDERKTKQITGIMTQIKNLRMAGVDDAGIKSILKGQIDNINRMEGKTVLDPATIDSLKINNAGDLIVQDIGGGQKAVTAMQPNGTLAIHIVDTTKQDRLNLGYRNLELAKQRISQGWTRLNPKAAAALEFAKKSGSEAAKKLYADNDAYNNAIEGNQILTEATDILNKDPAAIAGWSARLKATIGSIHPELEQALNSGDRKTFSRLMMSNADTFKKLLGPQISNADADLMFKLTGATASSESEIRAAIRTLRAKNDSTIGSYEHVLKGATGASPEAKPFSPQQRTKGTTAKNPKTGETIYLNSTGTGWVDRYGRPVK